MSSLLHTGSANDREYFVTIKTEYKILENKYLKAHEELKKWESRVNLAKQNGKTNLQIEAGSRVEILQNDLNYLTDQLISLKIELEKAAMTIHKSPRQMSNDPNRLLTDLNNLIGGRSTIKLEKEINEIKINNELKRLKNKGDS